MSAFNAQYENILASRPEPGVALVTLNRPKALNALNSALFKELNEALHLIDADKEIGAIVITGSEKAFAGASAPQHDYLPLGRDANMECVGGWWGQLAPISKR
jgi:enoyl-CoA hydratase